MSRIARIVKRSPWLILLLFVATTAFFAAQLPKAEVDPALKSQLPLSFPARQATDRIDALFGGTEMLLVVIEAEDVLLPATLKRVRKLSRRLERVKQIDRVLSLFTAKEIRSAAGQMVVEEAVDRIPRSPKQQEALRARLRDNELVFGNLVGESFKATALVLQLKLDSDDEETVSAVEAAIADVPGPETVRLSGTPHLRLSISEDIGTDVQRFLPIGILIMIAFLLVCFRRLRGVLLPLAVVVMAIIVAMGLIPLLGWKMQLVTVILPVILMAVANDYGIHILARYQELNRPGASLDRGKMVDDIICSLSGPVLLTGVTTIAGLLCLLSHIVVPARELGILAAIGVGFALLASLLFIPAALKLLPPDRPIPGLGGDDLSKLPLLDRLLHRNAGLVARHPRAILIGAGLAALLVGGGISLLEVDTNTVAYYPDDAPVVQAANLVNEEFGGFVTVSAVARGDIKSPAMQREIQALEQRLKGLEDVGLVTSISTVVRRMNRAFYGDDPKADRLPETREAVAQLFLLYSMSGDPEDFDRLVDFPYEHALITARIRHMSTQRVRGVVAEMKQHMAEHEGVFSDLGGFGRIFGELTDAIVHGQVLSLALSLGLIALLVGLLFRSPAAGLMALLPLALAMAGLFGLMGLLGIQLNVVTAMLSSIMIGVGVDYTIHFLWRYREERRRGLDPKEGVVRTLLTTGRGIVFNALSVVVGFVVLLLSRFLPVQFFGFLVTVSITTCLVGALVVLPALVLLVRPRFLEPLPQGGPR